MITRFITPLASKSMPFALHNSPQNLRLFKCTSLAKPVTLFNKVSHNFSFRNSSEGLYNKINNYLNRLPKPLFYYILGINGGIFLMMNLSIFDRLVLSRNLACSPASMSEGRIWTMVTSGFTHVSFMHLLFNGFSLYFFGR